MENLKLESDHRLVIGSLHLNFISNKFDNLKLIIQRKIDILVITETKIDSTFQLNQFAVQGYSKRYRFDRNTNGGGVYIYVREDMFCGCYHPPSQSDLYFFENIGKPLDKYSKHYDKFMLAGDFNAEESERCLSQFLYEYNTKNIVKENTFFKNALNTLY